MQKKLLALLCVTLLCALCAVPAFAAGVTVTDGEKATISCSAYPNATYRWYYSDDGGTTWTAVPSASYTGYATRSLTWTVTTADNGRQYRCSVRYRYSTTTTTWYTVTSGQTTITVQPAAVDSNDLDGAEDIVNDAGDALDGIYDYLPELSPGVAAFMAAVSASFPSWFTAAIAVSLTLSLCVILVRFLWS